MSGKYGWGGWTRTNTIRINSAVSYRLDHAPAASGKQDGPTKDNRCERNAQGEGVEFRCGRDEKSILFGGEACAGPGAPAAVHRNAIRVAHLLQIVCGQRRPESASAVEHQRRGLVRHGLLDVALDDALAEVNRAGEVAARPLAFLTHVHEREFFAGVEPAFHLSELPLLYARLCVIDERQ